MAIITLPAYPGYFDDSGDAGEPVVSLGGCVGTEAQWAAQDDAWRSDVLDHFGVAYMHMREVGSDNEPWAQFKDASRRVELARQIVGRVSGKVPLCREVHHQEA